MISVTCNRLWGLGVLLLAAGLPELAAAETVSNRLIGSAGLKLHNVQARPMRFKGEDGLVVSPSAEARAELDELRRARQAAGDQGPPAKRVDHLVVVADDFHNGVIELELAGQPGPGAQGGARGFVGVAFRLQEDLATYECFYLRPTNGRADSQERRNHSAQYVSHPEHPWFELRADSPGRYESYVDLMPAQWTRVRIEVQDDKARLYVHGSEQPTLIVNDLKLGAATRGAVALWIEGSTLAHFRDLTISADD